MESLIETFHLDWKLFLAQVVNFAIVFSVLYWFAFKPLTKVMAARSEKIAKSLDDAKKIEERLTAAQEEFNKTVAEAKAKANQILEKANSEAEIKKTETVTRAREEIGQIINQEKLKMQAEKREILKEIKGEVAGLVVAALEKVLSKKIDKKEDLEIIKKIVK